MYHPIIQLVNPELRRLSNAGAHWLPSQSRLEHLTSLHLCNMPVDAHRWHLDVVLPAVCSASSLAPMLSCIAIPFQCIVSRKLRLPSQSCLEHLTNRHLCNMPVEAHRWHLDVVLPAVCSASSLAPMSSCMTFR